MTDTIELGLNLLDHQLLDRDGRRCGKVDDLALEGGPGEELVVAAILSGPDVWRQRSRWLGRLAAWVGGGGRHRIPWEEVEKVRAHVELKRTADELGLARGDTRAARVLERIPGSDR